jgi:hypothetical protein
MEFDALAVHAALKQAVFELRFGGELQADTRQQRRQSERGSSGEAVLFLTALAQAGASHASTRAIGRSADIRTSMRRTTGALSRIATRSSGEAA